MMENLSKLTRLQNDRHLGRHSTDSVGSCLVLADTTGRHSPDTRATSQPILDRHTRPTSRPILNQVSVDLLPESRPRCRSSIGQELGRVSAEMSANSRSVEYRLTLSVYRSTLGRHLDHYVTMGCRRHIGPLSVVYGSTFGGILCIVNRLFC